jgi:hypothetical protein
MIDTRWLLAARGKLSGGKKSSDLAQPKTVVEKQ